MIDELHVRDVALIDDASIELACGLTVLTGETGAGKTALLGALRLVCGQRADAKIVRDGAQEAQVEARIVDAKGDEHIVARRLSAAGRSRCSIDGSMATVTQLSSQLSSVCIHSQHEHIALLDPAHQVELLDRYIDPKLAHLEAYRAALNAYRAAFKRLKELEGASAAQDQELDYQRFVLEQISSVNPTQGELESLEEQLPIMQNAASLAQACADALELAGSEGGAADKLASATSALEREGASDAQLASFAKRMQDICSQAEDLNRDIAAYARQIPSDPALLEETLTRLSELSGLMKRYGPTMDQVFNTWQTAQDFIAASQDAPQMLASAKAACKEAAAALEASGKQLLETRMEKACELCEKLRVEVAQLAMPDVSFEFSFQDPAHARWTDAGPGTAELMYRPSAQSTARPLRKIASGGELSRMLLGLECVFHDCRASLEGETLVFDEVDAGIGGATGEAVGRCLARLAHHAQVVVVTHLAQVAVHADRHIVVFKESCSGSVRTGTRAVSGDERIAEVARMLSGSSDQKALDHARTLLEQARG